MDTGIRRQTEKTIVTKAFYWTGHLLAVEMQEIPVPSPENRTGPGEDENERETTMKNTTAVKDPVCGMDIETDTAAGRTEYKGQTHYFCGSKCKQKFDLNPEEYLGKTAAAPKSGHGCCG